MILTTRLTLLTCTALLTLAASMPASASMTWSRSADWTGDGSNPDGAWSYQKIILNATAGGTTPWYEGAMTAMTWDATDARYAGNNPTFDWNERELADQTTLTAGYNEVINQGNGWFFYFGAAAAVWTNNTGSTMDITITGDIVREWNNWAGTLGKNGSTLEAVVVKKSGSTYTVLEDLTAVKPAPTAWEIYSESVTLNETTTVLPGDQIIFAVKGFDGDTTYLTRLDDSGVTITLIPEPASLVLAGLGGLIVLRRRTSKS